MAHEISPTPRKEKNMKSINPTTGEVVHSYDVHTAPQINEKIEAAHACFTDVWKSTKLEKRKELMFKAAELLRDRKDELAVLIAEEMGKVLKDGVGEIEKCALACEYYANNAQTMLADEIIKTEASKSFVSYQPLGVILAVMPWNFPFWQVFRFAAPNLMAGNVGVLKHASNVSGCALEIETIFRDAGFPDGCFTTLLVPGKQTEGIIRHPLVRAVTLTGSTEAGRKVAAVAGECIKKTVLELGGSDAYVVLADADIKSAATECAKSRLVNGGQSCVAAKRFIVESSVLQEFKKHFIAYFKTVKVGNPKDEKSTIGPLARIDLRDTLHNQVQKSIEQGAIVEWGGEIPVGPGAFYPPTVLSGVKPGMTAFDEELFGPVAAIIEASDEKEAFALANKSQFGLGGALFTSDKKRGELLACTEMEAGQVFVNTFVKSDPRLPFGGVKESGYGRELGLFGMREFVNAKTVYIA